MDNQEPAKSEKIFQELPTFVAPQVPDTTGDFTQYGLDDFSIYKVGEEKTSEAAAAHKPFDINNPDDFVIHSSEKEPGLDQHYVDLDFDYKPSETKAPEPAATKEQPSSFGKSEDLGTAGGGGDFTLEKDNIDNLEDETLDLIDMSVSGISQNSESQYEASSLNMDLSSHMEFSAKSISVSSDSSNTIEKTQVETEIRSETIKETSGNKDDLLKLLEEQNNDNEIIEGNFEPDIHYVSDVDVESPKRLVIDPEEYISNYNTSVHPATIPEEEFPPAVSTTSGQATTVPQATFAEQVTLSSDNSNNESDAEDKQDAWARSGLVADTSSDNSKQLLQKQISEAQTIDVKPQFAEEFVVDRSPIQQFLEEDDVRDSFTAETRKFQQQQQACTC